ncbi:hypothetical protein DMN91_012814 [Ooceraea biroi]|uniref:Uncharacterized protein n=1 Tax=Ooceraea biroi TaxID=2015173 RepID=A0A3L8D348_OOCBI|nr:hypothetical protein DMN91_012814 [Ooceraea biroi]
MRLLRDNTTSIGSESNSWERTTWKIYLSQSQLCQVLQLEGKSDKTSQIRMWFTTAFQVSTLSLLLQG